MMIPWDFDRPVHLITRSKVKGKLIGRSEGKSTIDTQIINYLVDRFAPGEENRGKGNKKNPGWFFGFKGDIWQAYALGVAYHDMLNSDLKKDREYLMEGKIS